MWKKLCCTDILSLNYHFDCVMVIFENQCASARFRKILNVYYPLNSKAKEEEKSLKYRKFKMVLFFTKKTRMYLYFNFDFPPGWSLSVHQKICIYFYNFSIQKKCKSFFDCKFKENLQKETFLEFIYKYVCISSPWRVFYDLKFYINISSSFYFMSIWNFTTRIA